MNHYDARKRESDGRWDYTVHNRRSGTYAIGYCHVYRPFTVDDVVVHDQEHADRLNAKIEPFREKYHTDGHATAEEARACYREYLLDQRLRLRRHPDAGTLRRCQAPEGCEAFTGNVAEVALHLWTLCDDHLNRETVEVLMPDVGQSWGSL